MPGRNSHRAYVGLGGNLGEPRTAMARALRFLDASAEAEVEAVSSLYRTPPWGRTDQPDFLNAVAQLRTSLSPRGLLELCLAAEASLHRVRDERWGPRTIDLDILSFGGMTVDEPGLQVPHPRMADRAFVIVPLAEIAPTHPVGELRAEQAAQALDRSGISVAAGQGWWR